MIREMSELCKQGEIRSVRVLSQERITDAVELMETADLTFRLTDGAALSGGKIPLAILLESSAKLPYTSIGCVTAREPSVSEPSAPRIPVLTEALNRGDRYEILVLSEQTDVDAINLSRILRSHSVNCVSLFDTGPIGPVARAILNAQLVILCGEYAPTDNEQISFAIRVLHEAGGMILRVGNRRDIPSDIADFTLSKGLPEDILAQISQQSA
jgi:hypothetical protein